MNRSLWVGWVKGGLTLCLMLSAVVMAAEGARPSVSFDHNQTKFPLTGVHTNTACESCHVKGVFKGTPTTCTGCHAQGGTALSTTAATKPVNHIPTTADCGTCHNPAGWVPARFSHNQLKESCATCHNGRMQAGKPVTHILTNQDCGVCHKTTAWTPAGYDHAGLIIGTGGCSTCHNGATATGKPPKHIMTTQQCDVCHQTFSAWIPAGYAHAVGDTDCISCHNGVNATGKPANHIRTSQQCSICHAQQGWLPAHFDHSSLTGYPALDCKGCHNGSAATGLTARHVPVPSGNNCDACHTFSGWKPSIFAHQGIAAGTCTNCHIGGYTGATVKPAVHLPTGNQTCDACHPSTSVWLPTSYAHTAAQMAGKSCAQCHNGTAATGRPATHAQGILSTGQCDVCHTTAAWKPTPMNHTGQTACTTCHNYNGNTWTPQYSGHINSGTRQCSDCHHSFTSWAGPTFNHQGISTGTNCATGCHDGTHATGRPTGGVSAHTVAPMTNGTCGSCHAIGTSASQTFKSPAPTMDHTGATACASCHSYSVARWSMPGSPTYANHISTTAQCSSCHLSFVDWKGAKINHTAMTAATNCYSGCHDGTHATGRPTSGSMAHMTPPMTNTTCGACHPNRGVSWLPRSMNNHTGATACASCHSYTAASPWTPTAPKAGHVVTTAQCSVCHKSFTTFAGAKVDHTPFALGSDCRTACHDGTHATGAPSGGVSSHSVAPMTNPTCGSCHAAKGVSWTSSLAMNHTGATACANCHSYSTARWSHPGSPVYPAHIPVTQQCSACHTSFTSWAGPTYAHASVTAGADCYTGCHDGTHATGRPTGGVSAHTVAPMTANTCGDCHSIGTSAGISFRTTRTMNNHTGATACSSCHSYSVAKWSNPGSPTYLYHINTTAQCSDCHLSTTSWAGPVYNHAGVTAGADCYTGCHDGTHATGRPTGGVSAHTVAPMTANTCGDCHSIGTSAGISFRTTRTMNNHTGATACSSCHSYSVAKWSGPSPTYAPHISTAVQCSSCHTTTAWNPGTFNHAANGVTLSSDCYTGCHDGAHGTALGRTAKHVYAPMTSNNCGTCHTSFTTFAGKGTGWTMNHTGATACSNCHSYSSVGNNWTHGATRSAPVTPHPATTAQCSSCHATAPGWANNVHTGVTTATTCGVSGCHGTPGQAAPGAGRPVSGTKAHMVAPMTNTTCGSCHTSIGGTWAIPGGGAMNHTGATLCSSCHSYTTNANGWTVGATKSPPVSGHPATGAQCSSCHSPGTLPKWGSNAHAGVTNATSCGVSGCHGTPGQAAPGAGRPVSGAKAHAVAPMTSATCGTCHANAFSTRLWTGAVMNHTGATLCSSCHSFSTANAWTPGSPRTGASLTSHQASSASQCSSCHTTTTFTGATYTHAGLTSASTCTTCHVSGNATSPKGLLAASNAGFPHSTAPMSPAVTACAGCHAIGTTWTIVNWTHSGITGASNCKSAGCHDTTNRAAPRAGMPAATHASAPMSTLSCGTCHTGFSSWATVTMSHSGVTAGTGCTTAGCHDTPNRAVPRAGMPSGGAKAHTSIMNVATCGACHVIGTAWAPTPMNHTGAGTGAACAGCHNGTAWTGKPGNTIHNYATTQGWTCDRCHGTAAWRPTSFNHTGVTAGSCANCHDGSAATGPTASHPANTVGVSATYKCDACHRTTAWLPATFTHSGITSGCANCHKAGFATTKSAAHFVTTVNCEKCHTTTAWAPIKTYVHTSIYYKQHTGLSMTVYADCKLCHINNNEAITGAPHRGNAAYAKECAWCHAQQFKSGPHKKTQSPTTVYYTVADLKNCSGACHEYSNNSYTTISKNRPGPQHRSTDGGF